MGENEAKQKEIEHACQTCGEPTPNRFMGGPCKYLCDKCKAIIEKFKDLEERLHKTRKEVGITRHRFGSSMSLPKSGNQSTCPTCNKDINKSWFVCPYCHSAL